MFKKHSIQMKMVKDAPAKDTDPVLDYQSNLHATELAAETFVNTTVKTTVKAAVTIIAVKTASELALHVARTLIK